jgi:hypothetical protein
MKRILTEPPGGAHQGIRYPQQPDPQSMDAPFASYFLLHGTTRSRGMPARPARSLGFLQ